MPAADELKRGAQKRERIDAVMAAETLVFGSKQQAEKTRVDVGEGRRQPPTASARRVGAQEPPFAVEHEPGKLKVFATRRRTERDDIPTAGGKADDADQGANGERTAHPRARHCEEQSREPSRSGPATSHRTHWPAMPRLFHFVAVTSTLSLAVRP